MVVSCWVQGCFNTAGDSVKRSFHYIPKIREHEGLQTKELSTERRRVWLANINRKAHPTPSTRICSAHFISGKPADLYDKSNPDWAPTIQLSDLLTPTKSCKKAKQASTGMKRYKRVQEREKNRIKHQVARTLIELSSTNEPEFVATPLTADVLDQDPEPICQLTFDELNNDDDTSVDELGQVTQSQVNSELQRLLNENYALKQELQQVKLNESSFENNDEKVKYYTGLPNFIMLMTVFDFVKDYIPKQRVNSELSQFERLIMTLMRLKLNFPVQYLAYQFNTSTSTVSRTFTTMIHILFVRFKHLLYWPKREELRQTMPLEFRKSFGQKTAVIIDCFEVFIQRPKNLLARAQTWSSYKHTNTVKFLIGITPQGSISFLSKAWGGRASDKYITENCGILGKLLPGDLVLADRGFDIADSVGMCCAQVNIPAFTKGKAQLSAIDVETTRKIAHVRIHVERVIGLVRNKYTILQDRLPVDFLICEEGLPVVDKIATVACALTNMSDSVVPLN